MQNKMESYYIACTRFTEDTYNENCNYRNKHNVNVVYGSPVKIRDKYTPGIKMFVVEMNNETNQIFGIGLIENRLNHEISNKIHKNRLYNMYIYSGKYWMSRDELLENDEFLVEIFENILFKKKSHLKRRIGITIVTDKLFSKWEYNINQTIKKIYDVFLNKFKRPKKAIAPSNNI